MVSAVMVSGSGYWTFSFGGNRLGDVDAEVCDDAGRSAVDPLLYMDISVSSPSVYTLSVLGVEVPEDCSSTISLRCFDWMVLVMRDSEKGRLGVGRNGCE